MVFYRESLNQYTRYLHQKFEFEFCTPWFVYMKPTLIAANNNQPRQPTVHKMIFSLFTILQFVIEMHDVGIQICISCINNNYIYEYRVLTRPKRT